METGGNLFGLWTPFGIPFIQYIVGPGRKAEHHHTHFRQDFDFLDKNADFLVKEHALHHIGTWHSHHSLELDHPSGGDTHSTLSGMRECHLRSFVLLIGVEVRPAGKKISRNQRVGIDTLIGHVLVFLIDVAGARIELEPVFQKVRSIAEREVVTVVFVIGDNAVRIDRSSRKIGLVLVRTARNRNSIRINVSRLEIIVRSITVTGFRA